MQNQVNIIADDMGNVIRQSNTNSEYGYVRLQQKRVTFGTNSSFVRSSNLSTLIHGKLEDLQEMNWKAGQSLAGKIQVREQLEPFSTNDPDRDYKYAGDTGIICCVDGQPIYRKTFFTPDVNAQDVLLTHTNGADIREANGSASMLDANSAKPTSAQAFGVNVEEKEEEEVSNEVVEEEKEEVLEEAEAETFEL
jgi:hypothetical protein|tara:strand:- start:28188 stop:28769 length:582 start_codon:yes stop_codon:yes gene_type:complete